MAIGTKLSEIDGPWLLGTAINELGFFSIYAVNTGVGDARSAGCLPTFWTLTFEFEDVRIDNMPTPETADRLVQLENRIREELRQRNDWVLAVRYTTPLLGRTFCFYTSADVHDLGPMIRPRILPYRGKVIRAYGFVDTDWRAYDAFREYARQGDADLRLVRNLVEMGVDCHADRIIEYVLYFPTEEAARESLRENFPKVDTEGPEVGECGWRVLVRLHHSPEFAPLAQVRRTLLDVCKQYGATYDGWGTPLTQAEGMEAARRGFGKRPDGGMGMGPGPAR